MQFCIEDIWVVNSLFLNLKLRIDIEFNFLQCPTQLE